MAIFQTDLFIKQAKIGHKRDASLQIDKQRIYKVDRMFTFYYYYFSFKIYFFENYVDVQCFLNVIPLGWLFSTHGAVELE